MDPVTGAIISEVGGSLLSGLFGSSSAKSQNKAAAREAEAARAFNREMMQSRHQWEVADLKAAGLNPILSAGGTPSMGSSPMAPVVPEGEHLANSAKSIGRAPIVAQELRNMRANERLLDAQAISAKSQAVLNQAHTSAVAVDTADKAGRKYANLKSLAGAAAGAQNLSRGFIDPVRKRLHELGNIGPTAKSAVRKNYEAGKYDFFLPKNKRSKK